MYVCMLIVLCGPGCWLPLYGQPAAEGDGDGGRFVVPFVPLFLCRETDDLQIGNRTFVVMLLSCSSSVVSLPRTG